MIKMDTSIMCAKKTALFFLVIFSFFQNACFADKTISHVINNAPQNVLVGSDVQLLDSFEMTGSIISGHYVAEMGGADLSVDIESNDKFFKIIRSYHEPGTPSENKSYETHMSDMPFIINDQFLLVSVKSGLLFLEKKSGSFGIPSDMWILYTKK